MAKFVKVILFLLLTVTLHGVAGNVFTGKAVEQGKYAVTYSMSQHEQISEPEFPCSPVAELNNLQSYQTSVTRVQRVQLGEYFSTLKNLYSAVQTMRILSPSIWERFIILRYPIIVNRLASIMYLL